MYHKSGSEEEKNYFEFLRNHFDQEKAKQRLENGERIEDIIVDSILEIEKNLRNKQMSFLDN